MNRFGPGICSKLGASTKSDIFFFLRARIILKKELIGPSLDRVTRSQKLILKMLATQSESAYRSIPFLDKWSLWLDCSRVAELTNVCYSVARQGPLVSNGQVMGLSYFSGSLIQPSYLPMIEKGLSICNGSSFCSWMRLVGRGTHTAIYQLPANTLPIGRMEGSSHDMNV